MVPMTTPVRLDDEIEKWQRLAAKDGNDHSAFWICAGLLAVQDGRILTAADEALAAISSYDWEFLGECALCRSKMSTGREDEHSQSCGWVEARRKVATIGRR